MTDDFDITMACLDAIEQEVRRAREALLATRDAELPARVAWCPDCRVVHSSCRICNEWDHRHVTFDEPLPAGAPIASKTARSDHPSLAHAWEARERHHQEHHQDAHTPREQPQTRSGGTESGEEPFVAASALGDKLRALGVRFQHGVSNSDPANDEDIELSGYAYWVTVQGIEAFANEADGMTADRDEWKRRRHAAVQECRFLHQDGLSRRDWHAKHCGAMEAADTLRAKVERVRALADEWAAKAPADDWGDDMAETFVADAGRRILAALDGADPR